MKTTLLCLALIALILFNTSVGHTQPSISGYNVYFGNLHNHCNVSDGQGTPAQAYAYARDVGQLDFFGLSDHANLMSASEWTLIKNTANAYNQDGVFAAFYGFEWTTYFSYGHVTIVNTDDYCSNSSPTNTFDGLLNWVSTRNCAAFFNHPGWDAFAFTEFDHFADPPSSKFVGIELWNDQDGFSKYYYNNGYYSNDGNKGYYDEALVRNWKVGAAGGDDNHTATWGTSKPWEMGVLAPAKTRTEIFNALLARRFYSTMDRNLVLSININGFDMGSTIQGGTWNVVVEAFDLDNELITDIDLIKNGAVIHSWAPDDTHPIASVVQNCAHGDYFYALVREADGNEAISSPVFISGMAQPPLVAITTPLNGTSYDPGTPVVISANASDPDGTVKRVSFYADNTLIMHDSLSPYTCNWTNPLPGTYSLTARATDFTGLITVSDSVVITVDQPELIVSPLVINVPYGEGSATFSVSSNVSWSASCLQEWCTVSPSGFGDGSILVAYNENLTPIPRTAEITVTGTGLSPVTVTLIQEGWMGKVLHLTCLLQGLYQGNGLMHPALDGNGIPVWGPGVADKITLELRDSSNYQNLVLSVSNIRLRTDGTAYIAVPINFDASYYLTVRHRKHCHGERDPGCLFIRPGSVWFYF